MKDVPTGNHKLLLANLGVSWEGQSGRSVRKGWV